jgi:hypothetical protein
MRRKLRKANTNRFSVKEMGKQNHFIPADTDSFSVKEKGNFTATDTDSYRQLFGERKGQGLGGGITTRINRFKSSKWNSPSAPAGIIIVEVSIKNIESRHGMIAMNFAIKAK